MPVMLIVGGRDVMLDSYETKRRLERLGPHVTVRFLAEAGHALREQAGPIDGFLRSHTATAFNPSMRDAMASSLQRSGS